ncbi:MAG: CRTAC1 family protein [Acidobacteria bacterium]|nr:CRTAC1 family protein [Acidobacteriota bacterium]
MIDSRIVTVMAVIGCLTWLYAPPPVADAPLFIDVAERTGLRFRHVNGAAGRFYMPEIMGSGGALLDYDGDGDLDVLLVQGGSLDRRSTAANADGKPRLFRNELNAANARGRVGPLRFTDVTPAAGFRTMEYGMGVATGDYDNDGDVDVYLTSFGLDALYRNDGNGRFTDVTAQAEGGLNDPRWTTSAAFLDYDRDGDLDLFVTAYIDFTVAGHKVCRDSAGAHTYCTPTAFRPLPHRLYRNNGDGTFADVSEAAGISKNFGNGLGVAAADYDGDGWIDLYVANDATANQLWINRRNGTFEDRGLLSGSAFNAEGLPEGSMGIAAGDIDNDGDEDLFVTNLPRETHTLYVNRGKGEFEDLTVQARLAIPSLPFTGFGTDWFDYDHDGVLDLFVANGAVGTVEAQRGAPFPFRERNQLYRGAGDGRFDEISPQIAGPAFTVEDVSRGAAFGDVDNDGDVDILVTRNGGEAALLLNQVGSKTPSLDVQLEGTRDNRLGLGARVAVWRAGRPARWRRAHTDGSYLSASSPHVHFGLGDGPVEGVLVEWPTGTRELWKGLTGRFVRLRQGSGEPLAR